MIKYFQRIRKGYENKNRIEGITQMRGSEMVLKKSKSKSKSKTRNLTPATPTEMMSATQSTFKSTKKMPKKQTLNMATTMNTL